MSMQKLENLAFVYINHSLLYEVVKYSDGRLGEPLIF